LTQTLERLNSLPSDEAESELLKCCGSKAWVRQMSAARPFLSLDELLETADWIWWALEPQDWLDAFHSHPKIGEQKAAHTTSEAARAWSEEEQAGTQAAAEGIKLLLARGNREYEEKFGFIFIICAWGKSSEEMLRSLQGRFKNDRDAELHNAAEEQRKITKLRLERLIDGLGS
jgi:OHCU decarboxylase